MSKRVHLSIDAIKTDGLQMRAALNKDVVREYAEAERESGAVFDPLTVFKDRAGAHWLADGFHRLEAAKQNGRKKVMCEVIDGEYADALRYSLGANARHGLRRTAEDKAFAVKRAYENRKRLGLPEVPSARLIADLVGVSNHFVADQLGTVPSWKDAQERTGSDGRTRPVPPPPTRRPAPIAPAARAEQDEELEADEDRETPPPPVRPSAPPAAPEKPRKPVPVLQKDERGKAVPPALAETWNRRQEVQDLATALSAVRSAIRKAQEEKDPLFGEMNFSSALSHLDMAYKEIAAAKPWCVCPSCQGIGCRMCKGLGLMSQYRFDSVVPGEMK
jgi:uncharacterized ParB-like nuclease family protein